MRLKHVIASTLLILPLAAYAQITADTRVYGDNDRDIATPIHSTSTASDSSAIQTMVAFIQGTGLTGWSGMTAIGSITVAGDPTPHSATLMLLGGAQGRLDVTLDSGVQSTVLNGALGVFLNAAGGRSFLSSDIAAAGLVAFPRFIAAGYPSVTSIVTDRGTSVVGGAVLRRISLDDPALATMGAPWTTEDLYFDPNSGYLVESAAPVHLSMSDSSLYMLETTYAHYQILSSGGTTMAPMTITQFLNGQLQWTLNLSDASTTSLPSASSFSF